MSRVFYRHYHLPDIKSQSLTFAIEIDDKEEKSSHQLQQFTFAWALCNEEDNFCKKTGREIAFKRLQDKDSIVAIRDHNRPLIEDLLDAIVTQMHLDDDPFYEQTVKALEFYHESEEVQNDLSYVKYSLSLPWHSRIMMRIYKLPIVQKLMGW